MTQRERVRVGDAHHPNIEMRTTHEICNAKIRGERFGTRHLASGKHLRQRARTKEKTRILWHIADHLVRSGFTFSRNVSLTCIKWEHACSECEECGFTAPCCATQQCQLSRAQGDAQWRHVRTIVDWMQQRAAGPRRLSRGLTPLMRAARLLKESTRQLNGARGGWRRKHTPS